MQVIELEHFIGAWPAAMTFSPDGSLLAVTLAGRVFIADPVTGAVRHLKTASATSSPESCGVAFTPDGTKLTVPHGHRTKPVIEVHDIETGAVLRSFALEGYANVCEPSFDGRAMYVALRRNDALAGIVRWDPITGERVEVISPQTYLVSHLAVSGDEKWLAGGRDGILRVWDISGTKPLSGLAQKFRIDNANIYSLALSSGGEFVAASCMHYGAPGAVYVGVVKTGEGWRAGEEPGNNARGLAFHPSRPVLAMRGLKGEVAFYDAAARAELQRYAWPLDEVRMVCFSPDGLRCAAAGRDKVIVWDVDV